ncbi:tetratricopeptide repeat protein [Desulfogranum mediterraneum]|uniref:tetratricopeptide repeat protein n=1 Tax=Desulfogranum mediterraneum TaxID=160661 RepID=UPI0003F64168|nr:tetratricopeptide repeat protein [Desulfogranum mediterraneum]
MNSDPGTDLVAAIRSLPEKVPPCDITAKVMQQLSPPAPSLWQRLRRQLLTPIGFQVSPLGATLWACSCVLFFLAGYWSQGGLRGELAPSGDTPGGVPLGVNPAVLAVTTANSPEANFIIGRDLLMAGSEHQAVAFLRQAARQAPQRAAYHFWQGIAYWQTGQYEQERASYLQSIRLKPDYLPALLNLGNSYLQGGKAVQAVQLYSQVLELNPREEQALYNQALAFRISGDQVQEIEALQAYLSQYRQGSRAWKVAERLRELGNHRFRSYQLGRTRVILDQQILLSPKGAAQQAELLRIAEVLRSAAPVQLHIVIFDPTGVALARTKAIELSRGLTQALAPAKSLSITSSWFRQQEPSSPGIAPGRSDRSIVLFTTPLPTNNQEQRI